MYDQLPEGELLDAFLAIHTDWMRLARLRSSTEHLELMTKWRLVDDVLRQWRDADGEPGGDEYIRADITQQRDELVAACESFVLACGGAGSYDDIEASVNQAMAAIAKMTKEDE